MEDCLLGSNGVCYRHWWRNRTLRKEFPFTNGQRGTMIAALGVLAFYSCMWILDNIRFEGNARTALLEMLRGAGLTELAIPRRYRGQVSILDGMNIGVSGCRRVLSGGSHGRAVTH